MQETKQDIYVKKEVNGKDSYLGSNDAWLGCICRTQPPQVLLAFQGGAQVKAF